MQLTLGKLKIILRPSFLAVTLAFSYSQLWPKISPATLPRLLILALIFIISIAIHEFGHALAFQKIGRPAEITLHFLGGTTRPLSAAALKPGEELFVSLMGPLAGLLLSGLSALDLLFINSAEIKVFLQYALYINLIWSAVNLLPLMPLDGGHALAALLTLLWERESSKILYLISAICSLLAAILTVYSGLYWAAVIFGYLVFINALNFWKIVKYNPSFNSKEAEIKDLLAQGAIGAALQKSKELMRNAGKERPRAEALYKYCCDVAQLEDDGESGG